MRSIFGRRLEPRPGDTDYLHLADLLLALGKFRTEEKLAILDYGGGRIALSELFPERGL